MQIPDLTTLGLTPEQAYNRRFYVGGSDAKIIMGLDKEKIETLANIKIGLESPEHEIELSSSLGHWTEPFHYAWFKYKTGREITAIQKHVVSATHPFMACSLDGLTTTEDGRAAVLQLKFSNPFWTIKDLIALYYAQVQHEMLVTGLDMAILSFLLGNSKWLPIEVPLDEFYACQLIDREREFWDGVQIGIHGDSKKPFVPIPPMPLQERIVDMTFGNSGPEWEELVKRWKEELPFVLRRDTTEEQMKAIVPDDAKEATGLGIIAKRAKNGRLSIRMEK